VKKRRDLVVLVSSISVVVGFGGSAALLWFFSSPAGATRHQATANLVTFAVQTLTLSAVMGFAAMATLETLKRLFHLRGRFFFARAAGPEFLQLVQPNRSAKSAEADYGANILRFDLPLEQIMAQLGHAADQALLELFPDPPEPAKSTDPAKPAGPPKPAGPAEAADQGHESPPTPAATREDTAEYKFLARLLGKDALTKANTADDQAMLRLDAQAALDNLQVSVGNAWRWRLRLAASVLSAVFALVALIFVSVPPGSKIVALASSFLLGGFLAGFFRDLAAIVERFRGLCSSLCHTASRYEIPSIAAPACIPHGRMAAGTRRISPC
jgi:hypothetical protein